MLVKRIAMLTVMISAFGFSQAWAGCAQEENGTCLSIRNGEVVQQSCEQVACANVHTFTLIANLTDGDGFEVQGTTEKTEITVNGKPGMAIPDQILKEGLTCYGTLDMQEVVCAKDAPF